MTWRVLYLRPVSQSKVARAIGELAEATGEPLEAYYPRERIWTGYGTRRRPCDRPLLPSMIFVNAPDTALPAIMALDGIWRRLDAKTAEQAEEMGEFILGLKFAEGHSAFDKTLFKKVRMEIGQRVRIAAGPYAGFLATIIGLNRAGRAKLIASVFGRSKRLSAEVGLLELAEEGEREAA